MSTMTPTRYALGLPPGSVRAILSLLVIGLVVTLVMWPFNATNPVLIPPYLFYLTFMILGHYFAAHGFSIAKRTDPEPSPLYLPGGMIRGALFLGLVGAVAYQWVKAPDDLLQKVNLSLEELKAQPFVPVYILIGFFLGVMMTWVVVGGRNPPYWFATIQAWFALLAMLGLCIDFLIEVVINPSLEQRLVLPNWRGILAGIVALYFGARS
jgi:hypothetical protein